MKMYCISETSAEQLPILFNSYSNDEEDHIHDYIELIYIFSGSGKHCINGKTYPIKKGCILYVDYGQVHSFSVSENMSYVNFLIRPEYFSDKLKDEQKIDSVFKWLGLDNLAAASQTQMAFFDSKACSDIEHLIIKILEENSERKCGFETVIKAGITDILVYMLRNTVTADYLETQIEPTSEIKKVVEYLDNHSNEKITLKNLSEMCNYSQDYLSKLMKVNFGAGFSEYLLKKRISNAVYLLMTTNHSISEISQNVGFTNKTHFYKMFEKYLGIKPSFIREYTRKGQNRVQFKIIDV